MKTLSLFLFLMFAACSNPAVRINPNSDLQGNQFAKAINFADPDYKLLNEAVFLATNEARTQNGRDAVKFNQTLAKAAQRYAERQSKKNFLAHEDPTGGPRTPKDRVITFGGDNPFIAENLAIIAGYPIASGEPIFVRDDGSLSRAVDGPAIPPHSYRSFALDVVQEWLDSPGHRKNLLSKDALELGVGAYIFFQGEIPSFVAVQNFQLFQPLR